MRRGTRLAKAKVKSPTKQSKRPSLAKRLAEALEQQTATSEILGVISSSRTDVQPVFDTIVRSASRLCGGEYAIVVTHDGELVHLVAQHNPRPGAAAETAGRYPLPLGGRSPGSRAILERRIVHVPDVELETELGPDRDEALRFYRRIDLRASITVPMVRGDAAIGAISVSRAAPGQFSERQIELLKTFADQAVIAIENVRLFTELQEKHREVTAALEQQTATAEILRVISRSPAEFQSVFDTIVANAVRVCQAFDAVLVLADGDEFVHRAHYGPIAAVASARYPLQGTVGGRAIREARVIHVENLAEAPDYPAGRDLAQRNGYRTTLSVPLIRDGVAIGAITIRRTEVLPFTDQQIALLQTFADQAVIAIENARLLTELQTSNHEVTEALGRETATAGILRAISSSPTDVQPVFEVIAETAARVLGGENVAVVRFDGQLIHLAATNNISPAELEGMRRTFPIPPGRGSVTARAILTRAVAHVHDVTTDPEFAYRGLIATGFRTTLSVPILHGGDPVGAISLVRRKVEPFSDQEIALLQTFADQAVIAIENVRLFTELQEKNRAVTEALEQQTATSEILRVISSSPTDIQPVMDAVAERAARLCDAADALIFQVDGGVLRRAAAFGTLPLGRAVIPVTRHSVTGRVAVDRQTLHLTEIGSDFNGEFPESVFPSIGVRTALGTPLLREGVPIGVILIRRLEARPFSGKQVQLLQTFADQAVIAIENVRLFTELQERNRQVTEALEQQTATADILRVISRSPTEVQPVFDAIVESATRLCAATGTALFTTDGERIYLRAGPPPRDSEAEERMGQLARGYQLDRQSLAGCAILDGAPLHVPDIEAPGAAPAFAVANARIVGFRSALVMPMRRDGQVIGVIFVTGEQPVAFTPQQIALLQTFADQAVIAIENVRLFKALEARNRELTESLDRQTATAEILRVISRSQADVQPVFDAIADNAHRLFRSWSASVFRFDGEWVHLAAVRGGSPDTEPYFRAQGPWRLSRDHIVGRCIVDRAVLNIADMWTDPDAPDGDRELTRVRGIRAVLAVPMLRDGQPIGGITITRVDVGGFPAADVELIETFADQAVIAIENARLLGELQARNRELTEALEQQTATAEILRIISRSPSDVQPVFEAITSSVIRLLQVSQGTVFRFDGEMIHVAASRGGPPGTERSLRAPYPRPPSPGREMPIDRCVLDGVAIHIADVEVDPDVSVRLRELARLRGWRAMLQVPMLRGAQPIGAITVTRPEAGAFSESEVDLLKTFADQAVIAVENARLLTELQARTAELTRSVDELTVLGEVGRAVSSTLELVTVLQTIVTRANQLAGTSGCTIWEYDPAREEFSVRATHFADPADAAIVQTAGRPTTVARGRGLTTQVLERREPVQISDITVAGAYDSVLRAAMVEAGHRALLGVPLLREDEVLGVLTVTRKTPGEFQPHIVRLLGTFATQSVLAIHNARLFAEIQRRKQYSDALVETSPVAIITLDLAGTVVGWNPGAERLFGYTQADAVGRPIDDLVGTPESRADIEANMRRTRLGERVHAITRRVRKDGTLVDVEISAVPVVVEGTQVGVIATYHDITELLHARRAAEAANEAKSAFLATMSHEIRTPMNAVIGMSGLLLNTALDDEQREYAEVIRQSGDALLTVINDILDFSKIEAGRLELESQPFDLRECIEGALDLVATRAAEKGLDLAYLIAEGTPSGLMGDVTRLRQVLLNLLSNAVKFTERGEIVLAVSVRCLEESEKLYELTFSVRDTGIGIPADRLGRLFQSFSQVDASTTRRYGGTGLGLAISKRLIELMGGGIAVTSEVGVGSEFTFTIRAAAAEVPLATRRDLRGEQPALRDKRVLVVDDNATNRRILAAHLDAWGVEVRATESPAEALARVRAGERFDIGVLDMHMPEMDGVELARAIREELGAATPPLILFTSLGRREARAERAGFAAYLSKPIKPSQLFDALVSVLPDQPGHVAQRGATRIEFDPDMARRHPLRILLAEDNVVNQKLALRLLAQMGYRADLAANGLEAIDAVERQTYDVILMDVQMPELDGFEASREITRRWPREQRPRIVAMTANALEGDRELCEAAGMDDYVAKPIRVEELVAALERCGARAMPASQVVVEPPMLAPAVDRTVYERLVETMSAAFVVELTDTFVEDGRQLVEALRRAFDAGDLDAFRRAAHSLKSNGDTLGAAGLAAQARALEAMARAGSLGDVGDRIEPLAREYERVIIALGELRHGLSA